MNELPELPLDPPDYWGEEEGEFDADFQVHEQEESKWERALSELDRRGL